MQLLQLQHTTAHRSSYRHMGCLQVTLQGQRGLVHTSTHSHVLPPMRLTPIHLTVIYQTDYQLLALIFDRDKIK